MIRAIDYSQLYFPLPTFLKQIFRFGIPYFPQFFIHPFFQEYHKLKPYSLCTFQFRYLYIYNLKFGLLFNCLAKFSAQNSPALKLDCKYCCENSRWLISNYVLGGRQAEKQLKSFNHLLRERGISAGDRE